MSDVSTEIRSDHFRYIAEHTTPEDPFLRQLKEAAAAAAFLRTRSRHHTAPRARPVRLASAMNAAASTPITKWRPRSKRTRRQCRHW